MATEAITVRFKRERETKRTMRFQEMVEDDQHPAIGALYVQKPAYAELGRPETVKVEVTAATESTD